MGRFCSARPFGRLCKKTHTSLVVELWWMIACEYEDKAKYHFAVSYMIPKKINNLLINDYDVSYSPQQSRIPSSIYLFLNHLEMVSSNGYKLQVYGCHVFFQN